MYGVFAFRDQIRHIRSALTVTALTIAALAVRALRQQAARIEHVPARHIAFLQEAAAVRRAVRMADQFDVVRISVHAHIVKRDHNADIAQI